MRLLKVLVMFLMPLGLSAQTKISSFQLSFHSGSGPFSYLNFPVRWEDKWVEFQNTFPKVKGIPRNLKNIKRGVIWFDPTQFIYQNFIAGRLSKKNFLKIKGRKSFDFDEKILVKNAIKCYVTLVKATDQNNDTVYLFDANNNYDFSDDKELKPSDISVSDDDLNKNLINTACQRLLNGEIINDVVPLLFVKSGSDLLYSIAQYATISLNIHSKHYELAVCSRYFYSRSWVEADMVLVTDSLKTKKANQDLIVNNDGFMTIDNFVYKFNRVDITKNRLFLQKMSSNNQYSSQVGFRAPLFNTYNLLNGENISLASFNRKYVLIDFWGTWCKPCRNQLPDLVKLNNSADSSKFVLMSIASLDNLDSLKKVISNARMIWPQIFSDKITSQYHVNAFPASFLINPEGIIIARNLSINDLKEKLTKLAILPYE